MALFCDFENVALGVRDAKYDKFDIKPVLERLLLKGSIVVKKAYCDWDRYKTFKASMHEASFELIEIPHVRQSGKNSADIRLVVDALDLCYTKSHVDTFVIISGDSDFSPLVSKLRENAKKVIGVGVKNSTSDLLVANCDEFIFYDDLVREQQRAIAKREASAAREASDANARAKRTGDENRQQKHEIEARKAQAIAIAVETYDALASERGESGKIWASVLKSAIKRRKPDFSESYFGFRAFGNLLDEAQARGLLEVGRDEKSGAFVYRGGGTEPARQAAADVEDAAAARAEQGGNRRKGRGGRADVPRAEDEGGAQEQRGNRRNGRDGNTEAPRAATFEDEGGAQPQAEQRGNRRKGRDGRQQAKVVPEPVAAESDTPQPVDETDTMQAWTDLPEPETEEPWVFAAEEEPRVARAEPWVFEEQEEEPQVAQADERWVFAAQEGEEREVSPGEAGPAEEPKKAKKPAAARRGRKTAAKKAAARSDETSHAPDAAAQPAASASAAAEVPQSSDADAAPAQAAKPARKSASRARRPRKTTASGTEH
ncbi:NYN domain protein [Caballeronia terrestris]|uniref:NYN domain protein n=2 Tax=Caballeronia terrestris TaxID=1226301 RepID=A0A158K743_9BURK|nr:NYN domain protein [Caballeronia terrestris]